jgi:hypothetical protein
VNGLRSWKLWSVVGSTTLAVGLVAAPASVALAAGDAGPAICSGTFAHPGLLTGTYSHGASIKGVCFVDGGVATIKGDLTLTRGSALGAIFANNDVAGHGKSGLVVWGNVRVNGGATLFAGCLPTSSPCADDPSKTDPTLSMAPYISGSIIEYSALGAVVHDAWIGGSVTQLGGGGGFNCTPTGVFVHLGSPVFSTYEDTTIKGSLTIADVRSCWMGTARVNLTGNATYINNQLADPDAIEIVSNNIHGDLICFRNSMAWDSSESPHSLYPRIPQPNTVAGTRIGQCRLSSPIHKGGKRGPGPF